MHCVYLQRQWRLHLLRTQSARCNADGVVVYSCKGNRAAEKPKYKRPGWEIGLSEAAKGQQQFRWP